MAPIPSTLVTTATRHFPLRNAWDYIFGFIQVNFKKLCFNWINEKTTIKTGEKPYKCEYCPKTFARGGQLTQHLVTHTGVKKFRCDHCGQKFSSAANLRLHQKTHLDERDFTCHLCGKGFYRPDALKKHISCYHHNIKAFHCKICNKMFKGHLPQHKRTHKHIKKHGCSTCGATFSQRSQLVVHQRIHSGERPYR